MHDMRLRTHAHASSIGFQKESIQAITDGPKAVARAPWK